MLTLASAYLERELGPFGLAHFVPLLEVGVPVFTTLHPVGLQQNRAVINAKVSYTPYRTSPTD
jgi:hypothetical protein